MFRKKNKNKKDFFEMAEGKKHNYKFSSLSFLLLLRKFKVDWVIQSCCFSKNEDDKNGEYFRYFSLG